MDEPHVLVETEMTRYYLPAGEYQKMRDAMKGRDTFIETIGFFGEWITIKLGKVETVTLWTAEAIASEKEYFAGRKFAQDG